jgi:signal transduction histidine kinase
MRASLAPVRRRLALWYIGTLTAILLALGLLVYARLLHESEAEVQAKLGDAVAELARALRIQVAAGSDLIAAVELTVRELEAPGRLLLVVRPDGSPLHGPALDGEFASAAVGAAVSAAARGEASTSISHAGQAWRAVARPYVVGGEPVITIAAADPAAIQLSHGGLLEVFGLTALAALLLVAVGGLQLVRVALRPIEIVFEYRQRFLAEAAHELRTPLAVLRGTLDVALAAERDPEYDEGALRAAAREVNRLGRLVDDLFLLVRVEAGERPLHMTPCFLDDVVAEAVAAGSVLARERNVALHLDGYEEAPVDGDPDLLRQLALALIDNALKFTPAEGTVRVAVGRRDERAQFVVEDSGPGIAAADAPRIFDRFFRSQSTRASAPGAGLGLTIARWIADAHRGSIAVEPSASGGARFVVSLPLRGSTVQDGGWP